MQQSLVKYECEYIDLQTSERSAILYYRWRDDHTCIKKINNKSAFCEWKDIASKSRFPYRAFQHRKEKNESRFKSDYSNIIGICMHEVKYDEDGFIVEVKNHPASEFLDRNQLFTEIEMFMIQKGLIKARHFFTIDNEKETRQYLNDIEMLEFNMFKDVLY